MKKGHFFFLLILYSSAALADLRSCFRDAQFLGHPNSPLTPADECIQNLLQDPSTIFSQGSTGKRIFGQANLIYVFDGRETLPLAGTQTLLRNITFLRADEPNNAIIVFQRIDGQTSYSLFNLDSIGNIRPYVFNTDPSYDDLTNIILFPKDDELAQIYERQAKIIITNLEADSRMIENGSKFRKTIKRVLDATSGLKSPRFTVKNSEKKELYVLDSDRILVFGAASNKPVRIIAAPGRSTTTEMRFDDSSNRLLFYAGPRQLESLSL